MRVARRAGTYRVCQGLRSIALNYLGHAMNSRADSPSGLVTARGDGMDLREFGEETRGQAPRQV